MRGFMVLVGLGALTGCGDKGGGIDDCINCVDDEDDTGGSGITEDDRDGDGFDKDEDCRDNDPDSYPGAPEISCDGIDQDCDGADLLDGDGDGHECEAYGGDDCDDTDPQAYEGAEEIWYDGIDQDCLGGSDYDQDGDGVDSDAHGGTDCDDENPDISPDADEVCYDDIDNDCSASTADCDCDADGVEAEECGGLDCDDSDPYVTGVGDEDVVDGKDQDCDGSVDEDAYCNLYLPTSMEFGNELTYTTTGSSGTTYAESLVVGTWDSAKGKVAVTRSFSDGASTTFEVEEDIECDAGVVSMDSWILSTGGAAVLTVTYDAARQILAADSELTAGTTWDYGYTATESLSGDGWRADGTITVIGSESVTVTAGTFDAVKLENVYTIDDDTGYVGSRSGTATTWWVQRLGLVLSEDYEDDGTLAEYRELEAYAGYYPE